MLQYLSVIALGSLMGLVLSKYIKYYPNLERMSIIVTLAVLNGIISYCSYIAALMAIFYIGMLVMVPIMEKSHRSHK